MENEKSEKKGVRLNTVRVIALGFFGVIFVGAVLLWLPICNTSPIAFIDALFTSTSAVCVTGLVTIVPATQFTLLGKIILLLLIQIGGLGVIAVTLGIMVMIHKKITVRERVMIQQTYNMDNLSGMVKFLIRVIKGTFFAELLGAILYATIFVPEFGLVTGIGYSVFHSVSAFCNAGIDILGSSSFMPYVTNPVINVTTMILIVTGGLGFTVWYEVRANVIKNVKEKSPKKRIFTRLSLHAKIVLVMTAALLGIGTVGFFLFEYFNPGTIGNLTFGQKIMASMFQSVTTRTAGFATISQANLSQASKLLGCILMIIGGSPGGTAGGVKTTTIAMLLFTCICEIKGKPQTECFGRRIVASIVRTGIVIVTITVMILLLGTMLITIFEPGKDFLDIFFETASAIGTVGLTADLTTTLSRASHIVLIAMMYIGRIGPITMALVLGGKTDKLSGLVDLPESRIIVG